MLLCHSNKEIIQYQRKRLDKHNQLNSNCNILKFYSARRIAWVFAVNLLYLSCLFEVPVSKGLSS